mmetsp:Transcript_28915/g.62346  ORF Transcript_28915/g.62346 Transcript_28915/m.62346 type:complete len:84 (-) Transcript_28915:621-872(-)
MPTNTRKKTYGYQAGKSPPSGTGNMGINPTEFLTDNNDPFASAPPEDHANKAPTQQLQCRQQNKHGSQNPWRQLQTLPKGCRM